jgi:hypothetical protein
MAKEQSKNIAILSANAFTSINWEFNGFLLLLVYFQRYRVLNPLKRASEK